MKYTPNYNLKKPEGGEYVNIADLNENVETIDQKLKENADGVAGVEEGVAAHLLEDASLTQKGHVQLSNVTDSEDETKAATPSAVKQAYDKATEALNNKPVDYGRYQAEFGWDGAIYENTKLINNKAEIFELIDGSTVTRPLDTTSGTASDGGIIVAVKNNLKGIKIKVSSKTNGADSFKIWDVSESKYILDTTINPVQPGDVLSFEVDLIAGRSYGLVLYGSSFSKGYASFNGIKTSNDIDILSGTSDGTNTNTSWYFNIEGVTSLHVGGTLGTITKTITPSDLKKWGNVKFTKRELTNTSVVCDLIYRNRNSAIPKMTSKTDNVITVTGSYSANQSIIYQLFDGNINKGVNLGDAGDFVTIDLGSQKRFFKCSIFPTNENTISYAPRALKIRGSNDEVNWDVLATKTNITWAFNSSVDFDLIVGEYRYYQIYVQTNSDYSGNSVLGEVRFYEETPVKTNIQSLEDLSGINVVQYESLVLKWTLSRNSIDDESPNVSEPSVTWEGAKEVLPTVVTGRWSDIATIINAATTYKKRIPLGIKAKKGRGLLLGANGGNWLVGFTTDKNGAYSIFGNDAFRKPHDPYLTSGYSLRASGNGVADLANIYIEDSDLVLEISNNNSSYSVTLGVTDFIWEAEG
ncbi:phage tail protein [Bacillus tianshenii]|nr:phage tail protein [Bacillus tianshenii]